MTLNENDMSNLPFTHYTLENPFPSQTLFHVKHGFRLT